jgi:hypothetical protein
VDQATRLAHLGEACLAAGRVEEARRFAERALENAIACKERGAQAWTEWVLGEIDSRCGDLGAARTHYLSSADLAGASGMRPLLDRCRISEALLAQ